MDVAFQTALEQNTIHALRGMIRVSDQDAEVLIQKWNNDLDHFRESFPDSDSLKWYQVKMMWIVASTGYRTICALTLPFGSSIEEVDDVCTKYVYENIKKNEKLDPDDLRYQFWRRRSINFVSWFQPSSM